MFAKLMLSKRLNKLIDRYWHQKRQIPDYVSERIIEAADLWFTFEPYKKRR